MKRMAMLLVLLAACRSAQQVRFERDLQEAGYAEKDGDYIRALEIYEFWRGRAPGEEREAELQQRRQNALARALRQGESYEQDRQYRRAIQHYLRLRQVAAEESVAAALHRARLGAFEQAIRDAREFEHGNRWRDAVTAYESVEDVARDLGREGEISGPLQAARQRWYEAGVAESRARADRGDWIGATAILETLGGIAEKIGRADDLRDRRTDLASRWYDAAGRHAEECAAKEEWDQAIAAYESARAPARTLGREGDLERALAGVRFRRAVRKAEQYEAKEQWADALRAYDEALGHMSDEGVRRRRDEARRRRFEQALKTGAELETKEEWGRAVAEYRSVEFVAKHIGKSEDLQRHLGRAMLGQALAEARALEADRRWREAVLKYEGALVLAKTLNREEEVGRRLARAREAHYEAQLERARDLERREDYEQAIVALAEARDSARGAGRDREFEETLIRLKKKRLEQAFDQAHSLRTREDFDRALQVYESVRAVARDVDRLQELETAVRRCREDQFDALLARGRRMEQQERWHEAIQLYESGRGLSAQIGRQSALERAIESAKNGYIDMRLQEGRRHERNERWEEAIRAYEQALPYAREVGREREVERALTRARKEQSFQEEASAYEELEAFEMPSEVVVAEFDPTGSWMAAADTTGQVWIFEAGRRCRCLHKLNVMNRVEGLAFSSDGTFLAVSAGKTVFVWEVWTARCVQTLVFARSCHAVSYSPDASAILIGLEDGTIELWSWKNPRCLRVYRGHRACVNRIVWCGDGASFVSACDSGEIRIWTYSNGDCCRQWHAHRQGVRHLYMARSGRYFATVGSDGFVYVWEVATWQIIARIEARGASSCAFADGDRVLLITDSSGCASAYEIRSCRKVYARACHRGGAAWVSYHPGRRCYVTCGRDRFVRVWVLKE